MTFGRRSPEFIIAQALAIHLQELQVAKTPTCATCNDTKVVSEDHGMGAIEQLSCPACPPDDKCARGLFDKFVVVRTDGSSAQGQKHDGCGYFVLDITHDPFALPALKAYADACRAEYPRLADDLEMLRHERLLAQLSYDKDPRSAGGR